MKYPSINNHPARRVSVPQLVGGINKTDNPSYINDNQLTDCDNMWFSAGRLRTRPGIEYKRYCPFPEALAGITIGNDIYSLGRRTMFLTKPNEQYALKGAGIEVESNFKTGFITKMTAQQGGSENSEVVVIGQTEDGSTYVADWDADGDFITKLEPFIPTVKINVDPVTPGSPSSGGYMYQGFNLLTNGHKFSCNTETADKKGYVWKIPLDRADLTSIDVQYNDLQYGVQESTIDNKKEGFSGEYVSDEMDFTFMVDAGGEIAYKKMTGRFKLDPRGNFIGLLIEGKFPFSTNQICASISNGLTFTVHTSKAFNGSKITSMTTARWFGGTRGGLENGTRLFVAGGEEEGIIRWSDLNKATYFSENNYAYVGDGSKITALAQQDELLVIFQEHAISYAVYVEGTTLSTEAITGEEIIDVSTVTAQFPITTIHPSIGCDCPNTVQLCSNRLVWLSSVGKVYCLVNNNQYNQRNVREISYAVEPLLRAHSKEDLKNARSAVADGKYFIFVADKVYVLDFGNTSFEYYTYQVNENRMKNYLSWYAWTLPTGFKVDFAAGVDDKLIIYDCQDGGRSGIYAIDFASRETNDKLRLHDQTVGGQVVPQPIPCSFRTKLFAFSGVERMKRILSCNLSLCKIPGDVNVSFITDNGSGEERLITIDEPIGEEQPDSVIRTNLYPNASCTSLFGVDVRSESAMAVEGISIEYREQGVRQ